MTFTNSGSIKFVGKKEKSKEHIVRFIDDLGMFASDEKLRVREFSKYHIERAYSWLSTYQLITLGNYKN